MAKLNYFYVLVKKSSMTTYWYSDFIGSVFLVRNDVYNKHRYQVADHVAWIDKVDAKRLKGIGIF